MEYLCRIFFIQLFKMWNLSILYPPFSIRLWFPRFNSAPLFILLLFYSTTILHSPLELCTDFSLPNSNFHSDANLNCHPPLCVKHQTYSQILTSPSLKIIRLNSEFHISRFFLTQFFSPLCCFLISLCRFYLSIQISEFFFERT